MPQSLAPIPLGVPITDRDGVITQFMRLRWQELMDSVVRSPTRNKVRETGQTAAIATTSAYLVQQAGQYRVSWYLRKTVADGVSSSLTLTLGWTDSGTPLTEAGAALTLDTTGAQQSGSKLVYADANADLTYAVAYASNTPNTMTYAVDVVVEQCA